MENPFLEYDIFYIYKPHLSKSGGENYKSEIWTTIKTMEIKAAVREIMTNKKDYVKQHGLRTSDIFNFADTKLDA